MLRFSAVMRSLSCFSGESGVDVPGIFCTRHEIYYLLEFVREDLADDTGRCLTNIPCRY